ncbi:MAG TPA: ABC transporter substrate-binding protein [Pseudolabrys sp.]|nr:ABC transporter substrate-binding protein [Pseudolabrys sp.]
MINRRATLMLAATVAASLAIPSYAGATTNLRFILDWAFQSQHAMFTIPAEDGTYSKLGLNVTIDRGAGSGDAVAKVASGAYDMGVADFYSMVRFNAQNPNNKLIAVMMVDDKSALAIELKASSSIKKPADLNGKTIAAPVGDASRQLFPLFAKANNIDEKSIKWVNVSPELREPLLLRGEADAITGHLTTVLINFRNINVKESDIRTMPYANYGVNLLGHALIVKPEFAEKNPEVVRNFIRGTVNGFNKMAKDPQAAAASIKKRDPLSNVDLEADRLKMSLEYRMVTENVIKNGISNVDSKRIEQSLKDVAEPFGITKIPPAAEVYTDRYLPPRSEMKFER